MLNKVTQMMLDEDMHIFKGETRVSNIKMQKVFEDCGYSITERVKDYYDVPTFEDAFKYCLDYKNK